MDAPTRHIAILAAMKAVCDAADPLCETVNSRSFPRGKDGAVAVWALNKGFELTADQVETLAGAFDLFTLALAEPASDAVH